jgi:hypothetical protein
MLEFECTKYPINNLFCHLRLILLHFQIRHELVGDPSYLQFELWDTKKL